MKLNGRDTARENPAAATPMQRVLAAVCEERFFLLGVFSFRGTRWWVHRAIKQQERAHNGVAPRDIVCCASGPGFFPLPGKKRQRRQLVEGITRFATQELETTCLIP